MRRTTLELKTDCQRLVLEEYNKCLSVYGKLKVLKIKGKGRVKKIEAQLASDEFDSLLEEEMALIKERNDLIGEGEKLVMDQLNSINELLEEAENYYDGNQGKRIVKQATIISRHATRERDRLINIIKEIESKLAAIDKVNVA